MKHEINFSGKKIALERQEIVELLPALEGYFVAVMSGVPDTEIPSWVADYMSNAHENRKRVKKSQPPKPAEEPVFYENNIYDFKDYKKQQES